MFFEHFKTGIKGLLLDSGALAFAHRVQPPSIAILRYHAVKDDPASFRHSIGAGIIHTRHDFKRQMELIAGRYAPVSVDDIPSFLSGQKKIPRRAVVVTFDDGYADNYEIAAPIMDELGVPGAFYVIAGAIENGKAPWFCRLRHAFFTSRRRRWSDFVDATDHVFDSEEGRYQAFVAMSARCAIAAPVEREKFLERIEQELEIAAGETAGSLMMTWDSIRSLQARGHVVGSHTVTHPNLARIGEDEMLRELHQSRSMLEEKLGRPVVHLSYPNPILQPHWSQTTVTQSRNLGYVTAVTCTQGPVRPGCNALALPRMAVPNRELEFRWALECTFLGRPT